MSLTRRIFFGAAASWFSRSVTILLGLVLMPVLFRTLPKEELGVWLLLGQSLPALAILDFGMSVTLTRRIAFAKGKSGSDPNVALNEVTRDEIADLMATGLRIYRVLAACAFIIALGLGFVYLRSLHLDTVSLPAVWTAWGTLCLSFAFTTWAAPWTCLLQGVGYIGWDAILASFVTALTLIGQIVVALCGGGLVGLAVVAVAGALLQRLAIFGFARRKRPELFQLRGQWQGETVRAMLPLAFRAWLTGLGSALLLYTDQFVITSLEGARELPAYRAAWVLVHNMTVVAVTFGMASGVFVSHLWQANDLNQVHRILERNVRLGWLLMLMTTAILVFAGKPIFALWLGAGNFVGYPVLLAFLISETLETQSYIISSASRATGDEAFAGSSLLAGGLKLGLSVFLAHRYGLLGVALGTVIALLLTNHWYMPWRGLQRLRYSRWKLVWRTILPCLAWFGILSGVLSLLCDWLAETSGAVRVATVTLTSMLLLAVALWSLVLEPAQRLRLKSALLRRVAVA